MSAGVETSARGLYKGAVGEGPPTPPKPSLSFLSLSKSPYAFSLRLVTACLRFSFGLSSALVVASAVSPPPRWATISGPYSHLLGVRASGWSTHFEECMVASAEA